MSKFAIISDVQIPFQDKEVLDLACRFINDIKPDGIIMNGDIVDMHSLSSFDKNPLDAPRLEQEIKEAGELMARFKRIPKKIWIGGNHEHRLEKYIWKKAPEFAGLDSLGFPVLFKLKDFGFEWLPYGKWIELGKLVVTHGNLVSRHSAQTARNHMEKYGTSILVGHVHRLGAFYKRDMRGEHVAFENGCLCRLDPEYDQFPNWIHGLSIVHTFPNGLFNVQQVPILDRRILTYGDRQWVRTVQ